MNIQEILKYLPHRYPFLLVDRVLECVPGDCLVAIKNVTVNEPCFTGHFPERPIFPGVLILEALAQATGILAFHSAQKTPDPDHLYYFVGIDGARFRKPVIPGDQLRLCVKFERQRRDVWRFWAQAYVDDEVVCEARLMCAQKEVVS
ncbi:MAG: 3-hydroxyacyl-[acyl-carrier-protein] dehydratase FabZ [Gammaproteobacteria bacterium]|nr:MAG: 3-hydroxyacyl-[acyl-carrier-protein] dehydratase FabZ [Gammaproteobacteria bacterium]